MRYLILLCLACGFTAANAQTSDSGASPENSPAEAQAQIVQAAAVVPNTAPPVASTAAPASPAAVETDPDEIAPPEYPGDLKAFLTANMKYPHNAMVSKISGKAVVGFRVGTDGTIHNLSIVRSSGNAELDGEAIRLISIMPAWTPGRKAGAATDMPFTLPISFKVE